jgi:hypothetical protein
MQGRYLDLCYLFGSITEQVKQSLRPFELGQINILIRFIRQIVVIELLQKDDILFHHGLQNKLQPFIVIGYKVVTGEAGLTIDDKIVLFLVEDAPGIH